MSSKVAAGMIVFNQDYILDAVLESIYPHVEQIFIVEGPVEYYVRRGYTTSTDNTVAVIKSFSDYEKKIALIQGQWLEKTEMVNAYAHLVNPDITHLWHVDGDEVLKQEDIETVFQMLPEYDSVGFQSNSFYGDFDHILTGFEQRAEYCRIQRWTGKGWAAHRPPTILNPESGQPWRKHRHLDFKTLARMGIFMYHYTYVFPDQVRNKTRYVHDSVAPGSCIDKYYERVYLPWVRGTEESRRRIEDRYCGVHEFLPRYRGDCRTAPFTGKHPEPIEKRLPTLRMRLRNELLSV